MFYMSKKCGKNASEIFAERQQFRHYLIQFFSFNLEQASQKICFSYKIFILFVLVLVYYSFLQVTRGNFIEKQPFKYAFGKMRVKTERNFYQKLSKYNLPHGCFHNIATFCKCFLGENEGRNQTTLQETRADQKF